LRGKIFVDNNNLAGSFDVEPNHSSSAIIYAHNYSGSHNTTHDDNVCYWNWKWHEKSQIKDVKAPPRREYIPSLRRITHYENRIHHKLV
jgi:hypothetical protein